MKVRTLLIASGAAVVAVLLTPRLISQETPGQWRARELAEPGPEHWLLEKLVGEWAVTTELYRGPGAEPGTDSGRAEVESLAGGRFVQIRTTMGAGPDETEHVAVVGFDRRRANYTVVLFEPFGTQYVTAEGAWDPEAKKIVMRGEDVDPQMGSLARFRWVLHLSEDEAFRIEILAEVGDDETTRMVETKYARKE